MSTTKVKIFLNNGDTVNLTVFGPVIQWMEEVAVKGVVNEEILIPVCSIARVEVGDTMLETVVETVA